MTTYNTGNPIGSKDPRDLYDNAENLDEAVNTRTAESWDDRFGVARKTWWGMEQDFQQFLINSGYENIGDYAAGLEITARNQVFWRDGELYRAGAVLELPYTTTGDWGAEEGMFVAVGDAVLRQELGDPAAGASLVVMPDGNTVADLQSPDPGKGASMVVLSDGDTVEDRLTETSNRLAETSLATGGNLLRKMMGSVATRGMYVRRVDSATIGVGIGMTDALKSIVEYRFRYNDDGLLLLRGVYSGVENQTPHRRALSLSGTFIENHAPLVYTTTVGDKMSVAFTGTTLIFRSRTDNRGGIWKVSLDDGRTRIISTWSENLVDNHDQVVFENLPLRTYNVVFEFMGDDPHHPPTGGTARGWVQQGGPNEIRAIMVQPMGIIDTSSQVPVVSPSSIPDFAIAARPAGTSYGSAWVPQHSSVNNVSQNVYMKLQLDGREAVAVPGEMIDFDFRMADSFILAQQFTAHNPGGNDGAMWQHHITHTITKDDPVLKINNKVVALQDTQISDCFFGMLPATTSSVDRLAINDGYELSSIPGDGSDYDFDWGPTSAMYVGEYAPGNFHAAACYIPSLKDTCSYGTPYAPKVPGRITHRTDNVTKVYWRGMSPGILPAGETLRSEHHIGVVSGVRFPNAMLMAI